MDTVPKTTPSIKKCTKCNELKPITEFHVKIKKTGRLFAQCKECYNAKILANYYENPSKFHKRSIAWQKKNPEKLKVIRDRGYKKNADTLRNRAKEYHIKNREADLLTKAAYRLAHPEKTAAYRSINKEKIAVANKAYYEKNKSKIFQRMKASMAKKPELYAAIHTSVRHRRRCRLAVAGGKFTGKEWQAIKAKYGRCLRCGGIEPFIKLTPDHVIPIAKGGNNSVSNLQPLCISCNASKNDKFIEYRPERLFAS